MKNDGLSDSQVHESRTKYGSNVITPPKRKSVLLLFIEKFNDPIIKILLAAALLSLIISVINNEYAETIGIICAILLATLIGFWFELDANKKFDILNKLNDDVQYKVLRNNFIVSIPKSQIVVGDVVMLDTGEEIPADGVLLESVNLQVNESSLTGELQTNKTCHVEDAKSEKQEAYPANCIYMGTSILNGHCVYKVTAVGDSSEFGKLAKQSLEFLNEQTPLSKQLSKLAKFISKAGFIVASTTFIGLIVKDVVLDILNLDNIISLDGLNIILQNFMIATTIIVVAVPEGLPMSINISLALSMRKMLKTNNLVRKMHACETMGATTVICTDKTGTLTMNKMQVQHMEIFSLEDQLSDDDISNYIKEGIAVNTTAFLDISKPDDIKPLGNPTESALLLWLHSQGINYSDYRSDEKLLSQLEFSTERKFMATIVQSVTGKNVLYIKGASEIIAKYCDGTLTKSGIVPMSQDWKRIEDRLLHYQNMAMRTMGFAYKVIDDAAEPIEQALTHGLTFLGIVAIADPIREDVAQAVSSCLNAGIDIKIVTGDTMATARKIGEQIGIIQENNNNEIISGDDFSKLSDSDALQIVHKIKIMCRARPNDKQRLVELLKEKGNVVAVTGDGTNDAPALNHADVGLSMGSGTSVAKGASDITIIDDSFGSIVSAVLWGRSLYKNIQRFIFFQLTINLAAMLIVLVGSLFERELPLTITQMLWINMIIDTFAAAALSTLPPQPNVLEDKPRKITDFIINPIMRRLIIIGGIGMAAVMLIYFHFVTSLYEQSIFFTGFVLLQFWNLFNAKALMSGKSAFYNILKAPGFIIVCLIILLGQILIVEFGGRVFRTTPLSIGTWLILLGVTSIPLIYGEIARSFRHKKRPN